MDHKDAAKLRAPFKADLIEQKTMGNRSYAYINHAVVTDRLIEVDPAWYWQPMATDPANGMPQLDEYNGLWIRLTILGVSRIGYGASEPHQKGADAIKTAISDAIKNAAMRFGVALDLWGADSNGTSAEALSPFTLRSVPPLTPVQTTNPELAAFLNEQRPDEPPVQIVPPEGEPHCKHNAIGCRQIKSGVSGTGKPYEGLFCTRQPYKEQCTPMSLDGRPWKKS
jgi:hypothetical protein